MSAILVHDYVPKSKRIYVSVTDIIIYLFAYLMNLKKWLKQYCIVVWRIISNIHNIINLGSNKNMVHKCVFFLLKSIL